MRGDDCRWPQAEKGEDRHNSKLYQLEIFVILHFKGTIDNVRDISTID